MISGKQTRLEVPNQALWRPCEDRSNTGCSKIFEQYAQIYGLACVDEAVEHAAKQALKDAYLLRAKNGHSPLGKGVVIYLKGLKSP